MKYLSVTLIIFLTITACRDGADSERSQIKRPVVKDVGIEVVRESAVDDYYRTSGTVLAGTISDISSRVMGPVTSIKVKEGDEVARGQLLLTIDDEDASKRAEAAGEAYRGAEKALEASAQNKRLMSLTYERYRNLYDDRVISLQEMDEIETGKKIADIDYEKAGASLGRAKADYEEAQINLGFAKIKSPLSGVVSGKYIDLGDMAAPGKVLLRVEDNSRFKLEVNAGEKIHEKVRIGMPVNAFVDALEREVRGRVSEIAPAVDPASRTFLLKIELTDDSLRSGMYARVSIPEGERDTILVPKDALVRKGQLEGVYTVGEEGVVSYRLIRTGREYDGKIEVLSGLKDGDEIIVAGTEKAIDGGILER